MTLTNAYGSLHRSIYKHRCINIDIYMCIYVYIYIHVDIDKHITIDVSQSMCSRIVGVSFTECQAERLKAHSQTHATGSVAWFRLAARIVSRPQFRDRVSKFQVTNYGALHRLILQFVGNFSVSPLVREVCIS